MDRKRKKQGNISVNKKFKKAVECNDWSKMVSGSSIRNYMIDDPLLDWLKYYNIDNINKKPKKHNNNINNISINNNISNNNISINNYTNFIMEQGLLFEQQVVDKLKESYNVIQVSFNNDSFSYEKHLKTVELMNKGVEIIYQGVLHDYDNNIYGTPDLLVRADKLNTIFNKDIKMPTNINSKLKNSYYYVVIDIKHSTLYFDCNLNYLKNVNNTLAYKGQVNIYNRLLLSVQGYFPQYGFILGKRSIHTKKNNNIINDDYMDAFAIVDYEGVDKFVHDKVTNAIEWIINMRTNGYTWSLFPKPSVNELYPNMKNYKDDNFRKIKLEISDKIGEITNIWWCGFKKRQYAHLQNIYSWRDKKFSSKILNINNNKIAKTIDYIININRNRNELIRTDDLISDDWRENNKLELYIDFEVLNSNIGPLSEDLENIDYSMIFMIGIGYYKNNKFNFKSFILEENTDEKELEMIQNMWSFINSININNLDIQFIHWSNAEINFYNRFLNKHPNKNIPLFNNSFDLYKLFVSNNIVVKGALNFSLKSIANSMYKHKMISTIWNTKECNNGLQAMMMAYNIYNTETNIINNKKMKEIAKYNMIDCKVMWEILSYLRINY
jgi:hypothetical protein